MNDPWLDFADVILMNDNSEWFRNVHAAPPYANIS
jgi:hypothetical protein